MSKTHHSQKYITLDDVRVSYDRKNDTIHLTSGDPDVQAGGFHLSLNRGTQTETTLRSLLTQENVIKNKPLFQPAAGFQPGELKSRPCNQGSVIVLIGRGGSGKTTSSILLAKKFASEGKKVALVDFDLRDGQIRYFLEQRDAAFVAEGTKKDTLTAEDLRKGMFYDENNGFSVFFAPKRPSNAGLINAAMQESFLNILRAEFDYIFVDVSPTALETHNRSDSTFLYTQGDAFLYMTEPVLSSLDYYHSWFTRVTQDLQVDPRKIGLVMNKYIPSAKNILDRLASEPPAAPGKKVGAELRNHMIGIIPLDFGRMLQTSQHPEGLLFLLKEHDSEIAKSFHQLSLTLLTRLGQ